MSEPTPEPTPEPAPEPTSTPPPAPDLSALVDKLASFDPVDFERRLSEIGSNLHLPDFPAVLSEAFAPILERLDALDKDVRKLIKTGAAPQPPAAPPADPTPDPTPADVPRSSSDGGGNGGGQRESLMDTLFGVPHV